MLNALLDIFFPQVCYACFDTLYDFERHVCTRCRNDLPVTNFNTVIDNPVEKVFYGRAKIEHATALLYFEKHGITQKLIHNLKYNGYQEIGTFLGQWMGHELKKTPHYTDVDMVIPVPLHQRKLLKRGYNQVERFGQEIAKELQVPFNDQILIKIRNTSSQVTKRRLARWQVSNEIFTLHDPVAIQGKHILLVDDLITTGATIESCIKALKMAENVKISVASMAITL